ncbi:MAG TPA: hypothetical protein DF613_01160, partial [Lachnospiraceae bacterium]|nr:hypothetical protein [Lachnospiraceae bacterium]
MVQEGKNIITLIAEDCVKDGVTLFSLARDRNIICKKNIITGETGIYRGVPEGDILSKQMASQIIVWEDKL